MPVEDLDGGGAGYRQLTLNRDHSSREGRLTQHDGKRSYEGTKKLP